MYSQLQKLLPLVLILGLIGLGTGGYFFYQYSQTQKTLANLRNDPTAAQKIAAEEVKKLVAEVGKLIDLPNGEDPTVATVSDIEKLKDQAFFQKAKNGDKVLIYANSKKVILYDPNLKKVIDIAPINIGSSSAVPVPTANQPTPSATTRLVLRNGTTTNGLTTKVETDLKTRFPQGSVILKENAAKPSYDKTVVVLLNDSAKTQADNLAKIFGITTLSDLPLGEVKPKDGDILVILGKDRI